MKFNADDLVEQGLVIKKTYPNGLSVLKYTRKVFFNALWDLDDRLLDCRGLVVDADDNVVVWPFTKVFNVGESGNDIAPDTLVYPIRKVNGFLGCVTKTEKYGVIYSTTGSLDSDFAKLVEKHIKPYEHILGLNITYMFEICDETDPHIVPENPGAYLIGMRNLYKGYMYPEVLLDIMAATNGWLRPERLPACELQDLPKVNHEGFMLHNSQGDVIGKYKSEFYLSKKALQRFGKNMSNKMWNDPQWFKENRLDEEFYDVFDEILKTFTQEQYKALTEQERSNWIQEYFAK